MSEFTERTCKLPFYFDISYIPSSHLCIGIDRRKNQADNWLLVTLTAFRLLLSTLSTNKFLKPKSPQANEVEAYATYLSLYDIG